MDEVWAAFRDAMLAGRYFEAHEILEDPWRISRDERLKTVIWVAAAFVHWQRGRPSGAQRLFTRVLESPLEAPGDVVECWLHDIQSGHPMAPPTPSQLQSLEDWARISR